MLKIFKYFKSTDWLMLALMFAVIVVQSWLDLQIPQYTGDITNLVLGATPSQDLLRDILIAGGYMLGYALASMVLMFVVGFLSAKIGAQLGKTLRRRLFYKIESFSLEEMGGFSTASLITRTTNDVQQVTMAASMGLRFIMKAPVMFIIAIIKSKNISGPLTLVVAGAIGLIMLMLAILLIIALPKFKKIQKQIDKVNGTMRENLTGLRVVRAYNAESYQESKFEDCNTNLTKTSIFVNRAMSVMEPFLGLIMNSLSLVIVWLGAHYLSVGELADPGALNELMIYSSAIILSFLFIIMVFVFIARAAVSAKRINEVLDKNIKITDGEGRDIITPGTVEFKNVYFRYPDAEDDILTDINLKIQNGQTVAFIGSTGSGKSTLIKLIPRFFDATKGEVLVGGVNVKEYTQKQLRDQIGYVPQKGVLFSGSIKENIIYGDTTASDEDMENSAKIARAEEFINQKTGRFDAPISQGGTNVSGGQKQRISIARALVKKPDILVFDDSFSALDYKTDKELRAELKANLNSTCLVVAQRIGTILYADKIFVLDHGKIVGEGTHKQLMEGCEVYREIAYSQLSKEDLLS